MKALKALGLAIAVAGLVAALPAVTPVVAAEPAAAPHEEHFEYERQSWSFGGFGGQYNKAQLQRGFQVYKEVCGNCHGLKRVNFRNLVQPGGPEFPEDAVKALAAEWPNRPLDEPNDDGLTVATKDGKTRDGKSVSKGQLLTRASALADPILGPYRNDKEARAAQNGALPPDLSVMARARDLHNSGFWPYHIGKMVRDIAIGYQEGGPDYIYNLLVSYKDEKDMPHGLKLAEGMNYNPAFPGNQIAMVPPLSKENFIAYKNAKGETAGGSLEENARDVAAFLTWSADPTLNQRKAMGWQVLLYLGITSLLLYAGKKRVWHDKH